MPSTVKCWTAVSESGMGWFYVYFSFLYFPHTEKNGSMASLKNLQPTLPGLGAAGLSLWARLFLSDTASVHEAGYR